MDIIYGTMELMKSQELKTVAIQLRKRGKTYAEIQAALGTEVPKSTLSYWCSGIVLSDKQQERIDRIKHASNVKARAAALAAIYKKRSEYLQGFAELNKSIASLCEDERLAKTALAILYLGEGSKGSGKITFGNANPDVIKLFLTLLRFCYKLDEAKFRCTLQCRADQDIKKLEKFWQDVTGIPSKQFYGARIDPRSIGQPSRNTAYKGVCRIDYLSAGIFYDIMSVIDVLFVEYSLPKYMGR
ncbi:MAG: hypothetical protein WD850_01745 [Candidatus Spechtbacterales bacterium]